MSQDPHAIPYRKTSNGEEIETRPLHVEEWLDGLPYIDFNKTCQILIEATKLTNQQNLKPGTRLELVNIYNRPYQYYIDSQIKTGAQHTLQSIDKMQQQIQALKQIAVNLSYACKLAANETLKRKTLWGQSKPPLAELLMSLNYLSHALIFSFLEYAPVPKNVWRELHFIYDFAESIKQENNTLALPNKEKNTIANAYKRIMLSSMADPYHLPFGAIWEIFEQLHLWSAYAEIKPFSQADKPAGFFVIDLDRDAGAIAFSKFKGKQTEDRLRLLDTNTLGNFAQRSLNELASGQTPEGKLELSPYYAKSILGHMVKSWGLPPERSSERQSRQGTLHLTCGVNAAYYFINGEEEFVPINTNVTEDMDELDDEGLENTPNVNYKVDRWNLVDQGPGGFAVIKNDKPNYSVRVGDLVAMGYSNGENKKPTRWTLGVIRWLMVKQNKVYKTGIQTISDNPQPGAVRALSGSELDKQFRRAFIVSDPEHPDENAVLVSKGFYVEGRETELYYEKETFNITTDTLLESSTAFEYFIIKEKE